MVIIWSFIAGLLLVYGVPYFFGGLKGKEHATPLGHASAKTNVLWGWLVFVIGGIFLHMAHMPVHPVRGFVFFAAGALIAALFMADYWPKHAKK
jgi:hypothetical protein